MAQANVDRKLFFANEMRKIRGEITFKTFGLRISGRANSKFKRLFIYA